MDLLEQLNQTDIMEVAQDLGLSPDRHRKIHCPFHKEDTPSLMLYPATNSFYCFGCGKTGTSLTLYAEINQLDYRTAIPAMAREYVPDFGKEKQKFKPKSTLNTVKVRQLEKEQRPSYLNIQVYESFKNICEALPDTENSRLAFQYLRERGFSTETLKRFGIFVVKDYASANETLKNNISSLDLQESGLCNERNNLIFYRHPIIIPYLRGGQIVFLQGRCIGSPEGKVPRYNFLNGKSITLFNADMLQEVRLGTTVYITEGAFDCMKLVQEGFPAVSLGTANVFKKDWIKLFKRVNVCFFLDNDQAGHKAANEMEALFQQYGIASTRQTMPQHFKDPNQYLTAKLGLNEQLGLDF